MKVLKFGGSSVGSPERIRSVASIVLDAAERGRVVVVVSAFQGVTDQLLHCAHLAEQGGTTYRPLFQQIAKRHHAAVGALLNKRARPRVAAELDARLGQLEDVLRGILPLA